MIGQLLRNVRAGTKRSRLNDAGLRAPATIRISSTAFDDGGPIPIKHAGKGVGEDISPALAWSGVPESTKQLVLMLEDVDVPLPRPILHTIALIDADVDHVDEGGLNPPTPGVRFLKTALPGLGYLGPRPISGHGTHSYGFHLFACDHKIPGDVSTLKALINAMRGHVVARGLLTGTYQR